MIEKFFKQNKKGFSLLITLILSFVALGFIAALIYLIISSTFLSGKGKRYTNALEAAKGITDQIVYLINVANSDSQICEPSPCDNGSNIIGISNLLAGSGYNANATVLRKTTYSYGSPSKNYDLYLINIKVNSTTSKDKAEVEFAYEVEK